MDTSEQYIKMRIVAIPDVGNGTPMCSTFRSENYCVKECDEYAIWVDTVGNWYVFREDILKVPHGDMGQEARVCQLERQDQLQEMVKGNRHSWELLYAFSSSLYELTKDDITYPLDTTSMEQLWLAFVMKEKFNKVWDGGNWVKDIK